MERLQYSKESKDRNPTRRDAEMDAGPQGVVSVYGTVADGVLQGSSSTRPKWSTRKYFLTGTHSHPSKSDYKMRIIITRRRRKEEKEERSKRRRWRKE